MRSPTRGIRNASPVPLASTAGRMFAGLTGSRSDAVGQMQAMGTVGTLFGIVNRTSTGTAKVDWRLWRNPRSPKGERTEVVAHAALDLWRKPNPFTPRQEFVEIEQQHVDLTGEGWWVVGRDPRANLPLELWPIRPDRMAPVPSPTDFIAGYVYRTPDGQLIPLDVDEVIQIKMPDPMDPYRGLGPVQAILRVADSQRYGIEWNRNFFINSAEPGGFVEIPGEMTDPAFKRWKERWREQHQGVAAAHHVGLLENGAKWVERKMTQRDMQFAQLIDVTRDQMREAFGIHKASLGLSDDVNRANAEAARYQLAEDVLIPRLDRFKGALNHKLLPLFDADPYLEFDYDDPTPDDSEATIKDRDSRVAAVVALVAQGADWDATLEEFDLPAIPRSSVPTPALPPGTLALPEEVATLTVRRPLQLRARRDVIDLDELTE